MCLSLGKYPLWKCPLLEHGGSGLLEERKHQMQSRKAPSRSYRKPFHQVKTCKLLPLSITWIQAPRRFRLHALSLASPRFSPSIPSIALVLGTRTARGQVLHRSRRQPDAPSAMPPRETVPLVQRLVRTCSRGPSPFKNMDVEGELRHSMAAPTAPTRHSCKGLGFYKNSPSG